MNKHNVYDCIFVSSILHIINQVHIKHNINIQMDDMYNLFPYDNRNNNTNFLKTFILARQMKITAFIIVT